jgi:hypothetical protein
MERERWLQLYDLAVQLSHRWSYGYRFSTACIVGVWLWAVVHDRPVSWACQAQHWPADLLQGQRLPAQSTMSRRLRSEPVLRLLQLLETRLKTLTTAPEATNLVKAIDGKPLPVGGNSKDPDARWGRGAGGLAKGYKLHAIWSQSALPVTWIITPMNVSEKTVAWQLIERLDDSGYLLGDPGYDSNKLFDWSAEHGHRLLAPRRKAGRFIHGYTSAYRRLAADFLEHGGYSVFHRLRSDIERKFGNCTSFAGGLAPLPAWIRRTHRVELWVRSKLLINAARALAKLANA